MIIDATNLTVGRLASFVAKKALMGERVDIVNCEKAVITGNARQIIENYKNKVKRGIPLQGPYYPKQADRIVRRAVRGMLPWKRQRGREAFKSVMCYMGVPGKFESQKMETVKGASIDKLPNLKYIQLKYISKEVGRKI